MMMKKYLLPALLSGAALLLLSYGALYVTINFLPMLAEEYYNPIFYPGADRAILFFLHPFVISAALVWFWNRMCHTLKGGRILKALEFGGLYALIATLPAMWITFSAMDVTLAMVGLWWGYGFLQATVAGLIFSWIIKR